MWYYLFKYVFMGPLFTLLGRPKVEGLENIPSSGPAILASNHLAVADSFYLPLVVRRRIFFLAKAEYFTGTGIKGWINRWFYTVSGQVPIDRTNADSAQGALIAAQRLLAQGRLLGMSYVWWALAVIVVAGVTVTAHVVPTRPTARERTPVPAGT